MIEEEQTPFLEPEPGQKPAKRGWMKWLAASGCAVFLCAAVFVGALVTLGPDVVESYLPNRVKPAEEMPRLGSLNNTMGDPEATVHIIAYGDYQCPYCLQFWRETEPRLILEYVNTGKVYYEYRSLGAFLGEESGWAAEGAYCAGDQNRFWEFHDVLYANWNGRNVGNYTYENLIKFGGSVADLDVQEFETCLREGRHKGLVEQDAASGEAAGVRATPTFFINGIKVEGAQPFEVFKKTIDDILNGDFNIMNG